MRAKAPCLNCGERYEHCHSLCSKYLSYRTELNEENAMIAAAKRDSELVYAFNEARSVRLLREKHQRYA